MLRTPFAALGAWYYGLRDKLVFKKKIAGVSTRGGRYSRRKVWKIWGRFWFALPIMFRGDVVAFGIRCGLVGR